MTFTAYDSFEEMQQAMLEAEKRANSRTAPFQRAIEQGSYVMRLHVLPPAGDEMLLIMGELPTYEALKAKEIELGADEEEAEYSDATLRASFKRGYVFGRWFSIIEPEGELGSAHVSELVPVSEETFEFFKTRGWRL